MGLFRRRTFEPWHAWWRAISLPIPADAKSGGPESAETAELVEGILNAWPTNGQRAWSRVTAVMERQLQEPTPLLTQEVQWFCEIAQNGVTFRYPGYPTADDLYALLGPNVRAMWERGDRLWQAAADATPARERDQPEDKHVENRQLRALLMAGMRFLPDGTVAKIEDVIALESQGG